MFFVKNGFIKLSAFTPEDEYFGFKIDLDLGEKEKCYLFTLEPSSCFGFMEVKETFPVHIYFLYKRNMNFLDNVFCFYTSLYGYEELEDILFTNENPFAGNVRIKKENLIEVTSSNINRIFDVIISRRKKAVIADCSFKICMKKPYYTKNIVNLYNYFKIRNNFYPIDIEYILSQNTNMFYVKYQKFVVEALIAGVTNLDKNVSLNVKNLYNKALHCYDATQEELDYINGKTDSFPGKITFLPYQKPF